MDDVDAIRLRHGCDRLERGTVCKDLGHSPLPFCTDEHIYCSTVVLVGGVAYIVDNGVRRMNEVTLRHARLVLGWATVFRWVGLYHLGM